MTERKGRTSRISGFYKLAVSDRLAKVAQFADLSDEELRVLRGSDPALLAAADKMIENVGGLFHLPVGFAANFCIDGRDRLVPMVIEEPSVVAASSNAARLLRSEIGIVTDATDPLMIGQIQLCQVPDPAAGAAAIEAAAADLIERANETQPRLIARGGGARELSVRVFPDTDLGPMVVVHLIVDVCEAMGANLVNGMAETLAPICESLSGGHALLRILSNLADRRLVHATGRVPLARLARPDLGLSGAEVADRVAAASVFAEVDPYRAATHNKGIMNGVDAFLLATGQDWRAVEAGAHAYAARSGRYSALATWRHEDGELVGRITLPMQVGTVGGVVAVHPVVKVLLKVLDASSASDIGRVAAAVGLAQNLAAILALATEGIQRGHMSLHARNIAAAAGASGDAIDRVVAEMIRRRTITQAAAESILLEERPGAPADGARASLAELGERHWPAIEALAGRVIPTSAHAGSLAEMVAYQLGTGGKRLRAIVPLAAYEALGRAPAEAEPLAAALEMLHNATLIHGDTEQRLRSRRGRDTLWVRYGADQAINAGDGMLFAALKCLDLLERPPAAIRRLRAMIVEHMLEVVRAQVGDLALGASDDDAVGLAAWLEVARLRVGGLFSMGLVGAAILADAEPRAIRALGPLGGHLGIIFTVQDELLDVLGGPGRRRGQALVDGHANLITRLALHRASPADREALRGVLHAPAHATHDDAIATAITLLEKDGAIEQALDILRDQQESIAGLARGPLPAPLADVITDLADALLGPLRDRVAKT